MKITTTFQIPTSVSEGITKGTLTRTGGIIQVAEGRPDAGQVVCWLREVSTSPVRLVEQGGGNSLLSSILSSSSILNLGATILFGVSTLRKLNELEESFDKEFRQMDSKLAALGSSIDLGFSNTFRYLESLLVYQQSEIVAEIKTAAMLAWSAQSEKKSFWRRIRLEEALSKISSVTEKTIITAISRMYSVGVSLSKKDARSRLTITGEYLASLEQFRLACVSLYLYANICSELGDVHFSERVLEQHIPNLMNSLNQVGFCFLRGSGLLTFGQQFDTEELKGLGLRLVNLKAIEYILRRDEITDKNTIYPYVLSNELSHILPLARLERFVEFFDEQHKEILDSAKEDDSTEAGLEAFERNALEEFCNLLDGAYEDLSRLHGHLKEYQIMQRMDMTLNDYRNMLAIDIDVTGNEVGEILYMFKSTGDLEYSELVKNVDQSDLSRS